MADIDVHCTSCGKTIRVSEFVRLDKMRCPVCDTHTLAGTANADAGVGTSTAPRPKKPAKLHLKTEKAVLVAPRTEPSEPGRAKIPAPPGASVVNVNELAWRKGEERSKQHDPFMAHGLVAWAVFLLIAATASYLRYGGGQRLGILQPCLKYAWAVVLVIYLLGVVLAFQDTMLFGVLAAVVPGFSFYYLFLMYDSFLVRAIAGGLLIAFAQDGCIQIWTDFLMVWFTYLSDWIGKGGGDLKQLPGV